MRARAHGFAWALGVVALAFAVTAGAAQSHPAAHERVARTLDTSGDHPLTTVATFSGNTDVAVVAVPVSGGSDPSGTLNLSGLPAGATIDAAWVVVIDYSAAASTALTFASQSVGSAAPTYVDPGYPLEVWRFDVTSLVTGNAAYTFATTGPRQCYGVGLVVVYSDPSLPVQQIVVNMGAEDLANASSTTSFAGFGGTGPGRLIVMTGADDPSSDAGESLAFNGVVIPGVLFNANLGDFTSLLTESVTVQGGANTATITTGGDQFGWAVAIVVGGQPAEPIPAAGHLGLAILAVAIAALAAFILVRRSLAA